MLCRSAKPPRGVGAQQVQRGRALAVGAQQPLGVRRAGGELELLAVDVVALVGGQGHAVLRLVGVGARLGELAGDAAHLHHRLGPGEGHHHRHLQHQPEEVADVVGPELLEALGAVAALQQEGAALGGLAQQRLQPARLAGEHQGRHGGQLALHPGQGGGIGIVGRDLQGGARAPSGGRPAVGGAQGAEARSRGDHSADGAGGAPASPPRRIRSPSVGAWPAGRARLASSTAAHARAPSASHHSCQTPKLSAPITR